jgi:phosphoribosyl 1,2-cyclic phosphodiesterase
MSLYITSLNSGSNGNCYYVGNEQEAVLIDAGISCREIEKRMHRLHLPMERIKAIFISHEHIDHVKGLQTIATKYSLPVYISPGTIKDCKFKIDPAQIIYFKSNETITLGALQVVAFPKLHDAMEPHSFTVESNGIKVGVFTDIGASCEHVTYHFSQCHAVFLEANYDEEMLENGRYPYYLKQRIRSSKGHLSNTQALELFTTYRPAYMSHVLLSHLSKENNDPQLVYDLFRQHASDTYITVASREKESSIYHINGQRKERNTALIFSSEKPQLSLF